MQKIRTSLFTTTLGLALSILIAPPVKALTIDIDDRTETPFAVIDGTPFASDESFSYTNQAVPGIFVGVDVRFIIIDPGTTNVSDILTLTVTRNVGEAAGTTSVNIDFLSDAESPLTFTPDPARDEIITETGDFQTVYSSPDSSEVNPDLIIRFASDIEGTAPEPVTLTLLGLAFAGMNWARRRFQS